MGFIVMREFPTKGRNSTPVTHYDYHVHFVSESNENHEWRHTEIPKHGQRRPEHQDPDRGHSATVTGDGNKISGIDSSQIQKDS